MLGSKIEACNSLEMTEKIVSVIEMTLLYDAQYSIVLLRPKNEVKLLTQSALGQICMGSITHHLQNEKWKYKKILTPNRQYPSVA